MPEFEFVCLSCGGSFSIQHHIKETIATPFCPDCSSPDTIRVYPVPTFHLKGHGWYSTDNPTKNEWGEEL